MNLKKETIEGWLGTDDPMCVDTVKKKYLLPKSILGHDETIPEFLDRVSMGKKEYRNLIYSRRFIPGGRILANMGLPAHGIKCTYSNCYVNPAPEDSIESIYDTCAKLGRTFSYGGGVGIDISKLAPKNARVNNVANESSGAVSFVNTFAEVSHTIGMRNRRGALMISINDTHPDLLDFIRYKDDLNVATGANMSIRVSNDFMRAVEKDEYWDLEFYRPESEELIAKKIKAKDALHLLAEMNWKQGEPGLLYWDKIRDWNLMSGTGILEYGGVNPCGEEPLPDGGSCLLGAMNLSEYVSDVGFNYHKFADDVRTAVRYLNDVLDAGQSLHPLEIQRESVKKYKQIGLGIMGLADAFVKMGYTYGDENSQNMIDHIGAVMALSAIRASCDIAEERGPFEGCDIDVRRNIIASDYFTYVSEHASKYIGSPDVVELVDKIMTCGLRNTQLLTCAPTGTTSTILNVSGGIEPMFALEYTRKVKLEEKDVVYKAMPKVVASWIQHHLSEQDMSAKLDNLPPYMVTARDIAPFARIQVQARWQRFIDASISSTINLPENTSVEAIEGIYMAAWKSGLKGITVFRENCNRDPILTDTSKEAIPPSVKMTEDMIDRLDDRYSDIQEQLKDKQTIITRSEMGECLPGNTYYEQVACGHMYITVNRHNSKPVEVFMNSTKSGGCTANISAIGRLASTILRSGIDPELLIDSTIGLKCAACAAAKGKGEQLSGLSCSDVMARIIRKEYENYKAGKYSMEDPEFLAKVAEATDALREREETEKRRRQREQEAKEDQYPEKSGSRMDVFFNRIKENTAKEQAYRGHRCPDCGSPLYKSEGCVKCMSCGYSKC